MRQCPYCKADIEENARYCYFCMHDLEQKNVIDNKTSLNGKKTAIILCSVFGAILLALVLFLTIKFFTPKLIHTGDGNLSNDSLPIAAENNNSDSAENEDINHNQSYTNNNSLNNSTDNHEIISSSNSNDITDNSATNQKDEDKEPVTDDGEDTNNNADNNQNEHTDPPAVIACTHSWQEITDTQPSERKVTYYKCPICYAKFKSLDAYYTHFDAKCGLSFNAHILRERYETVNEWESYDKTVIAGYKCTKCGETKPADN